MQSTRTLQLASSREVVVMANGVFDILHKGHILHLQQAAKMGDKLVVSITRDAFVGKGKDRPLMTTGDRMVIVSALGMVHSVCSCDNVIEALEYVKPDILVKGPDYVDRIEKKHSDYCRAHGIEIRFTSGEKKSSGYFYDRIKTVEPFDYR